MYALVLVDMSLRNNFELPSLFHLFERHDGARNFKKESHYPDNAHFEVGCHL